MKPLLSSGRCVALIATLGGVGFPLAAQPPGNDDRGVVVGAQLRQYRIGSEPDRITVRQVSIPFGLGWSRGRWDFDFGGAWVESRVEQQSVGRSVASLTDTQVRGSYTFGQDLLVASVAVNLPSGLSRAPPGDFPVLGAISSSFLAFPIGTHGSGFSTTTGLALAVPAGSWNVGIGGSVRWNGRYTPYVDGSTDFDYQPGIEGRVRAGADRIVGRSRVTAGVTFSTFGTDEFGTGTTTAGLYRPGARWTIEANLVTPVGQQGALAIYGWHYLRSEGDSLDTTVPNRERITAAGLSFTRPLVGGLDLTLAADGRIGKVGEAPGKLVGAEIGLGIALGQRFTLLPAVRYDIGSLDPPSVSSNLPIRGLEASVFLRSRF